MMRGFVSVMMVGVALGAFAADDPVVVTLTTREAPDTATLFRGQATVGNSRANWSLGLDNKRAHGNEGRHLKFSVANGKTFGYSALINPVKLTVNGIPWNKLQVKPKNLRKWADGVREGVEFMLNFDGAPVRVRASMTPGSPWLDFEVKPSAKGLTPVTNILVGVSSIPSFLDCGHGKPTRFDRYRRSVRTASRYLKPQKTGRIPLQADDRYYVMMDEDYDGSSEDKGMGPCAVRSEGPVAGDVDLNDGWVTSVWFKPDPTKPFRFSMIEYPDRRFSNAEFEKKVSAGYGNL